ncbi:hypothetical protein DFH08DRAFT_965689 [Mycena albidolilacea]|uniref:F-box domain-containing protein n=1 Tax=Mycena albidolilacea TaxID=1033008 RepID=A0AAD7EKU4_9AGAR|nr:hypothetical protein DFH08DRAFT_965689 [Mycena albidolilacea]
MSVKELRTQIEKISDETELQKKFLAKLRSDKSLLQHQLNAVLDPVARLPPETSSNIFLHCLSPVPALDLPPSGACGGPDTYLILLLTVCNAWTTIALSTPDLWTAIDIIFPCAEGFPEILETWLQRARKRPLSILSRGNLDDPSVSAISAIIWKHGQQLRSLEICADTENEDTENEEEHGTGHVDLFLGMLKSGPLPLFQTLVIRRLLDESGLLGPLREFSGPQILELLSLAPNLMECTFHDVDCVSGLSDLDPRPKNLILPNLCRLSFGPRTAIPNGEDGILQCLSVPRLEVLSVSLSNLSANDLISFLERSSPPLQELVISDVSGLIHDIHFHDFLRLLPSLQHFEVWWPSDDLMTQLSAALEDSFWPNLRDLIIHNLSPTTTLLHTLYARRPQFQTLRIEMNGPLPVEILSAMRELVASGIQIYIGTKKFRL